MCEEQSCVHENNDGNIGAICAVDSEDVGGRGESRKETILINSRSLDARKDRSHEANEP